MRVGIDCRVLGVDHHTLRRGIARYTMRQIDEVTAHDNEHEYVLLIDVHGDDASIGDNIRRRPNVTVAHGPRDSRWPHVDPRAPGDVLRRTAAYEEWVQSLSLDLLHVTAPMMLEATVFPYLDVCPVVATAYDLIPLLYPAQFLSDHVADGYQRGLVFLQSCSRLLAISEATKNDLVTYLDVDADAVHTAYPAVDAAFTRLAPAHVDELLANAPAFREETSLRIPQDQEFIVCVSHTHYGKNLNLLLDAYAQLDQRTRDRWPLVLAGHLGGAQPAALREARTRGLHGNIITTGMLTDAEMAALYNRATLFVHPSRYEGFGLPALEAMACGAPVVSTKTSSMPEAAGDAAVYIDPDDAAALAGVISTLLLDRERREELRERGLVHAATFTGERLAAATLHAYADAAATERPAEPQRPRLAIWSPVPPQESGIADYTMDLLSALTGSVDVDVYVDDGVLPSLDLLRSVRIRHSSAFDLHGRRRPYDRVVFHYGASFYHEYMLDAMRQSDGLVVLHDLVWSNVWLSRLGFAGGHAAVMDALREIGRDDLADEYRAIYQADGGVDVLALEAFHRRHPLLELLFKSDRALAVTSPALAETLTSNGFLNVAVIPMGVRDPRTRSGGFTRAMARARLRLPREAVVIAVLGIVLQQKHIHVIIDALRVLHEDDPTSMLCVVGDLYDAGYADELRRQASELGLVQFIRFTGRVTETDYDAYTAAADVVVALRYEDVAQTSAAVSRTLAAGRALIMSDVTAWRIVPSDACRRVPIGASADDVAAAIAAVISDDAERVRLEQASRVWFESSATTQHMAAEYMRCLRMEPREPEHTPVASKPTVISPKPLVARPRAEPGSLPHSKVCNLEDFEHPELRDVIRDVADYKRLGFDDWYPTGREHRKDWEMAMAVRALRDHGALREDAVVLGVGAGSEATVFHLSRHVRQVIATDLYMDPGLWVGDAPAFMLTDPWLTAMTECRPERITPLHMDGRVLRLADDSVDAIFSSSSVEHFGALIDVAHTAYEMGRVLKPGGVLSLATELLVDGGKGAAYPTLLLLTPEDVLHYIVEASGLQLVEPLDLHLTPATAATVRGLHEEARVHRQRMAARGTPEATEWADWAFPHIVLQLDDHRFTSIHLTLQKLPQPVADNRWAAPPRTVRATVERAASLAASPASAQPPPSPAPDAIPGHEPPQAEPVPLERAIREQRADARNLRAAAEAARTRMRPPAPARERSGGEPSFALTTVPPPDSTLCPVPGRRGAAYSVFIDASSDDPISSAFRRGDGAHINTRHVDLIAALVPPDGLVLDVGANIGSITLPLAAAGRRVIAVDGSPRNVELLRASVAASGLSERVRVVNAAVMDSSGVANFIPFGPWGQLVEDAGPSTVRVPATTIDDLLSADERTQLRFVKIDVDGSEPQVLAGATATLSGASRPDMLVELCHYTLWAHGSTVDLLLTQLAALGYLTYHLDPDRLWRRRAGEFQPETVTDVLAVSQLPVRVPGWGILPSMPAPELARRAVRESELEPDTLRWCVAGVLQTAPDEVLAEPQVRRALDRLLDDESAAVRSAAAWWLSAREELRVRDAAMVGR